ncbi:hypothetical protein V8G54_016388 [Vigna mungo]|uniref:Uncharacterized protein n=1 Tax=Vigna mungo TaxID=3915 RepID=A0AAQ3NNV4_VIGMU
MLSGTQNTTDPDQGRDIVNKTAERQPDLVSKGIPLPLPMHSNMSVPVRSDGVLAHPLQGTVSDAQSTECPTTSEPQNQQDELTNHDNPLSNNQTIAHFRDAGSGEDSDQTQKRMKTYK